MASPWEIWHPFTLVDALGNAYGHGRDLPRWGYIVCEAARDGGLIRWGEIGVEVPGGVDLKELAEALLCHWRLCQPRAPDA